MSRKPSDDPQKPPRKFSTVSNVIVNDDSSKKAWQIIFHSSNSPKGNTSTESHNQTKDLLVTVEFLPNLGHGQGETFRIERHRASDARQLKKAHPFATKLKTSDEPKQIRLKIRTDATDGDDSSDDDRKKSEKVKWHLDYVLKISKSVPFSLVLVSSRSK